LEIRLRRNEIITELDKRLDATAWPPDGAVPHTGLVPDRTGAEVTEDSGWPWVELWLQEPHGRLVICGFKIVATWDNGPTPRFLLVRILEYLKLHTKALSTTTATEERTEEMR
jgi:hypothetical protein